MKAVSMMFVGSLMLFIGCHSGTHPRPPQDTLSKVGVDWLEPLDSKWEMLSAGKPYSIQKVPDPAFDKQESLRFELRSGDAWLNESGPSYRAEIDTYDTPPINAVKWYRFAVMLPPNFPSEDNRLVLFQWHGADKKSLGEVARSPVLAFRYRQGILTVTLRHSPERIVHDPDAVSSEQLFKTSKFPLGKWNDFVVQARWSFRDDGFIDVWWDGKQVVDYHGPVGYNDDVGPYVQFGLYRDDSSKTYISYISGVRGGSSAQDVGFVLPPNTP